MSELVTRNSKIVSFLVQQCNLSNCCSLVGTEWQRVLKMLSDFPQHRFRFFLSSYCSSSSGDNIIFGLWNFKCNEKTCEMSMVDISIIKFALHEKVSFFTT